MPNEHDLSVEGARRAADRGELAAWVETFLASDGSDNAELGEQLRDEVARWVGPVRCSFDDLHRLAGPPDQPTLVRLKPDDVETVEDMEDSIDDGWEPAPLVATYQDGQLVVEDGNHRIEGLRRAGHDSYWTVVGLFDPDDREAALELAAG